MSKKGKVLLEILEATDLPAADTNGSSDPYVKIKIGGKAVAETKTISKNLNPKWNEKHTLDVADTLKDQIELNVFDKDTLKDDGLGSVTIGLSQLFLGKRQEFNLPLKLVVKHNKESKIKIALTALDFGPKDNSAEIEQQKKAQQQQQDKQQQQQQQQAEEKRRAEAKQKQLEREEADVQQRNMVMFVGFLVVAVAGIAAYKYLKKN